MRLELSIGRQEWERVWLETNLRLDDLTRVYDVMWTKFESMVSYGIVAFLKCSGISRHEWRTEMERRCKETGVVVYYDGIASVRDGWYLLGLAFTYWYLSRCFSGPS